ncbi:hypothetical protein HDU76_010340, partial [Blyttiomyces sp. JEL0837]
MFSSKPTLPKDVLLELFTWLRDDPSTLCAASSTCLLWHETANVTLWESPHPLRFHRMVYSVHNALMARRGVLAEGKNGGVSIHGDSSNVEDQMDCSEIVMGCMPSGSSPLSTTGFNSRTVSSQAKRDPYERLEWPLANLKDLTFPHQPKIASYPLFLHLLTDDPTILTTSNTKPKPTTYLRSITIPNTDSIPSNFLRSLLASSPNLQSLSLIGSATDDALLKPLPKWCPRLKCIKLVHSNVSAGALVAFAAGFPEGLERLDLERLGNLNGWLAAIPYLSTGRWDRLRTLSVQSCGMKATLVLAILDAGGGPSLETINVSDLKSPVIPGSPADDQNDGDEEMVPVSSRVIGRITGERLRSDLERQSGEHPTEFVRALIEQIEVSEHAANAASGALQQQQHILS